MIKKNKPLLKNTHLIPSYEQLRQWSVTKEQENASAPFTFAHLFMQKGMAQWVEAMNDVLPSKSRAETYKEIKPSLSFSTPLYQEPKRAEIISILTELTLAYVKKCKEA